MMMKMNTFSYVIFPNLPGDVFCEIETDKATLDMEVMDEGYLAKIIVPAGSKDIAVGDPIAVVVESKDSIGAFKNYTVGDGNVC